MLILAGIAINLTIGDNGIITRAQKAVNTYDEASRNEEKAMQFLESYIQEATTGEITAYPVNDNNPGELAGEGTEGNPYKIESIEDLVALASIVNTGSYNGQNYSNNTFYGQYIELVQTLDFNYDGSYGSRNSLKSGGLKDNLIKEGFNIIGINSDENGAGSPFLGTFDGNENTIKNLYLKNKLNNNRTNGEAGLFGISAGTIKNLSVIGSIECSTAIDNKQGFGAIAAMNGGTIENCNANIHIYGNQIGNEIKVVGGIAGANTGIIDNCCAKVNIENLGLNGEYYIGGITGENYNKILNCISTGNIKHEKNDYTAIGGITGENQGICLNQFTNVSIEITDNSNSDAPNASIGGIIGTASDSIDEGNSNLNKVDIDERKTANVYFNGNIKINKNSSDILVVGGIIGSIKGVLLENSYSNCILENIGTDAPALYMAVGWADGATIKNCRYIDSENTVNANIISILENNQVEDLTDTAVLNYMNSYVNSASKNLRKWTLSGATLQFE